MLQRTQSGSFPWTSAPQFHQSRACHFCNSQLYCNAPVTQTQPSKVARITPTIWHFNNKIISTALAVQTNTATERDDVRARDITMCFGADACLEDRNVINSDAYWDVCSSGARFSKNLRKNPKFSLSFS